MDKKELDEALSFLKTKTNDFKPYVGVICGSGLSGLVNCLSDTIVVEYGEIPHFPNTTVAGHSGELCFGNVDNTSVVLMRGRFHSYEGHDMKVVTTPVRLMAALGVKTIVVTNAAGGVNRSFNVGDLMVISDHIGFPILAGKHPLVGPNDDTFGGPRFLPVSDAYEPALRQLVIEEAAPLGMSEYVHPKGCYAFVSGPTYESAAESQMLLRNGCDSVGMSTVPEVLVARHCGMKVLGLSLITNQVRLPGDSGPAASHEEVLETVAERSKQIEALVRAVIAKLNPESWATVESRLTAAAEKADAAATKSTGSLKDRILGLDLTNMTPLAALNELQALKTLAGSS